MLVTFLDFSKAFDTVPHMKLCAKLDNIGVRGNILNWIKAFLTNYQQHVCLDGHHSDWTQISSGVPQGSILGPQFFLVYINDINTSLSSETRLFNFLTKYIGWMKVEEVQKFLWFVTGSAACLWHPNSDYIQQSHWAWMAPCCPYLWLHTGATTHVHNL